MRKYQSCRRLGHEKMISEKLSVTSMIRDLDLSEEPIGVNREWNFGFVLRECAH